MFDNHKELSRSMQSTTRRDENHTPRNSEETPPQQLDIELNQNIERLVNHVRA